MKINILAILLLMIAALFVVNVLYYINCTKPTVHMAQMTEHKRSFKHNPLLHNKNFYDEKYWAYQEGLGEFGGKAEAFKFASLIRADDTLIDYGGGGGFLLNNLKAARKILIEPNPHARISAMKKFDLEAYASPEDVPESVTADIIISNHCLEHVPNPLEELTKLYQLLRKGGTICIVVPVDAALGAKYSKNDIDHHIYTWNALLLGNLVADAGFDVISSEEIQYKWPSDFNAVWDRLGEDGFLKAAHDNAVRNKNYQVRLVAIKI
jgi:SAM-dependent methyltransferase